MMYCWYLDKFIICLFCFFFTGIILTNGSYHFADDILYGINWLEKPIENNESRHVVMHTSNFEKYLCHLPTYPKPKHSDYDNEDYNGPTEMDLLKKIFDSKICSTKESPYWFYEICHGRHVRQYHEALETSGKPATVQEYYLGHYQVKEANPETTKRNKKPMMTINSVKMPYFSVNMSSGDYCDLINQPRSVEVLYFCHENIQANLYDFQEIRSCEYQAIVFTKFLCEHPAYKMKDNFINEISCSPLENSPVIPKSLMVIQTEIKASENIVSSVESIIDRSKLEPQIKVEAYRKNGIIYYRIITVDKNEPTEEKTEEKESETENSNSGINERSSESNIDDSETSSSSSSKPGSLFSNSDNVVNKYLSAKYCIENGASYWRHRICFLRKISQYHVEVDFETQEIILGFWNKEKHLKWLEEYPIMKPIFPAEKRMDIYHHYSDGTYCEEIKANRKAILKISCVNDNSSSVTVTVSEPTVCSYVVIVRGSAFCPIVKQADEFGLYEPKDD